MDCLHLKTAIDTATNASLPPTATNHVTLQTYWRGSASVVISAQRYRVQQSNITGNLSSIRVQRYEKFEHQLSKPTASEKIPPT